MACRSRRFFCVPRTFIEVGPKLALTNFVRDILKERPDAVARLIDPLSYVSGQVPLTARGVLRGREGKGEFQLTSAEILGMPLPKPIVQELVSFFSRTRENPNGFDIDAPFELPAKIREIVVNRGEAVVIQ